MCCIEYSALTWEVARGNYKNSAATNFGTAVDCVTIVAKGSDPHCAGAYQEQLYIETRFSGCQTVSGHVK